MFICLFEDPTQPRLHPLTHVTAEFELRSGAFTARERVAQLMPASHPVFLTRTVVAGVTAERGGITVNDTAAFAACRLFVSARALLDETAVGTMGTQSDDAVFLSDGRLIGIRTSSDDGSMSIVRLLQDALDGRSPASDLSDHISTMPVVELDVPVIRYPWDLIAHVRRMLLQDATRFPVGLLAERAHVSPFAVIADLNSVYVGPGAAVSAGAILDPAEGPVIIDAGAQVMTGAIVLGPSYIGPGSLVKPGAKIHGGCSAGPGCKIGGEVEDTVFHSHASKQHDGFAGHSYFAAWTNLGADTNTSDLKNNYSHVRMTLEGIEHDTGRMFLGTIMAEHSKTAINTMLNTGTCVGVGCVLHGAGFPPKFVPSFSWGGADGLVEHEFERCARTADTVMHRRQHSLTPAERAVLRHAFEATAPLRAL